MQNVFVPGGIGKTGPAEAVSVSESDNDLNRDARQCKRLQTMNQVNQSMLDEEFSETDMDMTKAGTMKVG